MTMTGEELLVHLKKLPAAQRKREVVIEGENKFRDVIFTSASKIRVALVDNDGNESEDGNECILIEK
jgi:hypothetical protein